MSAQTSLVVVVALAIFLSVVSVVGITAPTNNPEPSELVTEISETQPDSVEGRLNETVRRNGTVISWTRYSIVNRPREADRRVIITDQDGSKTTYVENETTLSVYTTPGGNFSQSNSRRVIIPALQRDYYPELLNRSDVEYAGVETVVGRDAHVLVFTPTSTGDSASLDLLVGNSQYRLAEVELSEPLVLAEHRVWIDREQTHVLRERTTFVGPDNQKIIQETGYEYVAFNTNPDPEVFSLEPPEDPGGEVFAESIDADNVSADSLGYDSVVAAENALGYTLPNPRLPDSYQFVDIHTVNPLDLDQRWASMVYTDGETELRLLVKPEPGMHTNSDGEMSGASIDIRGNPGVITVRPTHNSVEWECGNQTYTLAASLPVETLVDMAESIECS